MNGGRPTDTSPVATSEHLGRVQAAWLFTRGEESVRIVRVGIAGDRCRLLVNGPGTAHRVEEFPDGMTCALHQSEMERRLVADGFRLNGFSDDRRTRTGSAPPFERRR